MEVKREIKKTLSKLFHELTSYKQTLQITSTVLEKTTITKIVYYYSLTGKTEAVLELIHNVNIVRLNDINPYDFKFSTEKIIIIGTPTYGRGAPPKYFLDILRQLHTLRGRKIGLFGSGNTIYGDDYCGALDVLEEILSERNQIIFKYKFEGYPTEKVMLAVTELINKTK